MKDTSRICTPLPDFPLPWFYFSLLRSFHATFLFLTLKRTRGVSGFYCRCFSFRESPVSPLHSENTWDLGPQPTFVLLPARVLHCARAPPREKKVVPLDLLSLPILPFPFGEVGNPHGRTQTSARYRFLSFFLPSYCILSQRARCSTVPLKSLLRD